MMHFTEDEKKTFRRFRLEILSANPSIKNISFTGADLESAIFTDLKTMISDSPRLICVRHLMKRNESKLADLLPKIGRNIADRKPSSSEIIKSIYGSRVAIFCRYDWIYLRIDAKHFSQDFTNGSFEIKSFCFFKASSNLQGSVWILWAFFIKMT